MPPWHRRRPLKRWRYVGVYGETALMCAGIVRIAGVPQGFWALWDRERQRLYERTSIMRTGHIRIDDGRLAVDDAGVLIDLRVEPQGDAVEVVSDHAGAHIWTRKQPVAATGTVTVCGESRLLATAGLIDDSAGYYARRTDWEWSAGVGATADGRPVAWNLVAGVHDAPDGSERTVWLDGRATEVGPVTFRPDLDGVTFAEGGELCFTAESVRRRRDELILIASDYVQPFGLASGTLPGGIELAEGYGVMERHSARW
jgi:hypothetical protein